MHNKKSTRAFVITLILGLVILFYNNCGDIRVKGFDKSKSTLPTPAPLDSYLPDGTPTPVESPEPSPTPEGTPTQTVGAPLITCSGSMCFDEGGFSGQETGLTNFMSPSVCNGVAPFDTLDYFPSTPSTEGFFTIFGLFCTLGNGGGMHILFDSGKMTPTRNVKRDVYDPYQGANPEMVKNHFVSVEPVIGKPGIFLSSNHFGGTEHSTLLSYRAVNQSVQFLGASQFVPAPYDITASQSVPKDFYGVIVNNKIVSLYQSNFSSLYSGFSNSIRDLTAEGMIGPEVARVRTGSAITPLFSWDKYLVGIESEANQMGRWSIYELSSSNQLNKLSELFQARFPLVNGAAPTTPVFWRTLDRDGYSKRFLAWNLVNRTATVYRGETNGTLTKEHVFSFSDQLPSGEVVGSISGDYVALAKYSGGSSEVYVYKKDGSQVSFFKKVTVVFGTVVEGPNFSSNYQGYLGNVCLPGIHFTNNILACDINQPQSLRSNGIQDVELTPYGTLLIAIYDNGPASGLHRTQVW